MDLVANRVGRVAPNTRVAGIPVADVHFSAAGWRAAGWLAWATFGHCYSRKPTIFGYKLHVLNPPCGVIRNFELAAANLPHLTVGEELLVGHADLHVLGDKGYTSQALATNLRPVRRSAERSI